MFKTTFPRYKWHTIRCTYLKLYHIVRFDMHTHICTHACASVCCCPVTKSCPALCDPIGCSTPFPCPLPCLRVCSNSYPLSQWCHLTMSSSAVPSSSCSQSLPASGYFPLSHLFASGGQSIGASASMRVCVCVCVCVPKTISKINIKNMYSCSQ